MFYSFFEATHIISVIAWMAGLLYLPRLFVYHSDNLIKKNDNTINTFKFLIVEFTNFEGYKNQTIYRNRVVSDIL